MQKIGLVLEGGASRGVFTAGVLDYWMEQGISFPYVVGVSAGACNAADLVSRQIGRTRRTMIHKEKAYRYAGFRTFWKTRQWMDMDLLFDLFPQEYFPFDFDTYFSSDTFVEYGCTECTTGKAIFLREQQDPKRLMQILRASCAMHGAVKPVTVDGKEYVDGGLSDSIPIRRAFAMGCSKVVVIQTRGAQFRMKPSSSARLIGSMYRKYPAIRQALRRRPIRYNRTLNTIIALEQKQKVLSLRPTIPEVKRMEQDYGTLMRFYHHGYTQAKEHMEELRRFLQEDTTR